MDTPLSGSFFTYEGEHTMTTAQQLAETAIERKNFSFAEAVLGRAYPEIQVPIYLDERKAQEFVEVAIQLNALEDRLRGRAEELPLEVASQLSELTSRRDALASELKAEEYVVTIRGISGERSIQIEDAAYEAFPREYEERISPITGAAVKELKPSEKREELITTLLRQAHLKSITAPDGSVDEDFSDVDAVAATWSRLPYLAIVKIDEAINKSRVAVDYYEELVDEVF